MTMKTRAAFLAGAALGYVLGTRAGRERFEQIKHLSRQVSENPRVQEAAGVLRAQAGELADNARQKVGDRVQDKMPGRRRAEPTEAESAL
jgi:membrane protein DedA with SNARE-associated domain